MFASGVPVTMIGLNVTHQALATPTWSRGASAPSARRVGRRVVELDEFFGATLPARCSGFAAPPVHDPCAVALRDRPGRSCAARRVRRRRDRGRAGRAARRSSTSHGRLGREPNARVGVELDVPRFWDLVVGGASQRDRMSVCVVGRPQPRPRGRASSGSRRRARPCSAATSAQLPGGKGANQAVAAARLGQDVTMVGRVGADEGGDFCSPRCATTASTSATCSEDAGAPTGLALITVDEAARTRSSSAPASTRCVGVADVEARAGRCARRRRRAAAATRCRPTRSPPAPRTARRHASCSTRRPRARSPDAILSRVDVLVPNRGELGACSAGRGRAPIGDATAAGARRLRGPRAVVVTLGAEGALVVETAGRAHVPAPRSRPSTRPPPATPSAARWPTPWPAGPRARRRDVGRARRRARATRDGAQPSLPTRAEVERR